MSTTYHRSFGHEKKPSIRLQLPPDPRYARTAREALVAFASLHEVAEPDLEALLFAVGEALANAIEHSRSTEDIIVEAQIGAEYLTARVTDRGTGVLRMPQAKAPLPDALTERGRGIPIMQRCADVFRLDAGPGGGTTVTLGRRRRDRIEDRHAAS